MTSLLTILCCCFSMVVAMRGDVTYSIQGNTFGRWNAFGAYAGASFQQEVIVTSGPPPSFTTGAFFWAIIATSDQFSEFFDMSQSDVCNGNMSTLMFQAAKLGYPPVPSNGSDILSQWQVMVLAPNDDYYSFLFVSCNGLDITAQFNYHLVNPGGEELSTGYIPVKTMSLGFVFTWVAIGSIILTQMAVAQIRWKTHYRDEYAARVGHFQGLIAPIRALHGALVTIPAFFVINAGVLRHYFMQASETGVFDTATGMSSIVVSDFATAAVLLIVMLLSRGWQITRLHVDKHEMRHVFFITCAYILVYAAWEVAGGFFLLFLLVLIYVLMLRYIFASLSFRLTLLRGFRNYVSALFNGEHDRQTSTYQRDTVYIAQPAGTMSSPLQGTSRAIAPPAQQVGVEAARDALRHSSDRSDQQVEGHASSDQLHAARLHSVINNDAPPSSTWRSWFARSQYALLGDPRLVQDGTLTTRQIAAFKYFRSAIVTYLTMDVMLQVWNILALNQAPWVGYLIAELLNLSMAIYLCWLFRARASPDDNILFDPYGYSSNMDRLLDHQHDASPEVETATPQPSRFFVVQNPDSMDATGKLTQSVAIAEISDHNASASIQPQIEYDRSGESEDEMDVVDEQVAHR